MNDKVGELRMSAARCLGDTAERYKIFRPAPHLARERAGGQEFGLQLPEAIKIRRFYSCLI